MKALRINVELRRVEEIEISGSLESIYESMGNDVTCFCVPIQFENGDGIYADDEALLGKEIKGGFMMANWRYPLTNNCLVIGSDYSTGDSKDVATKALDLEKLIQWVSVSEFNNYNFY